MGGVDRHRRRCAAGQPTWFAADGQPDEVPRREAGLWLGAAERGRADHRQGRNPGLTPAR
jgi:hypothetical protein